jgi:hypothetical protein
MDQRVKGGKLALIYRGDPAKPPQVWFQDLSCKWFFIANTFTDYFRLMIMHLGLPHWHYAFTSVGLDPLTLQWFRFLLPERLAIDMEYRKSRKLGARGKAPAIEDRVKVESLKRKKRRMKLKAKGAAESIIEKFSASSSKSAKFARTKSKGKTGKKKA